MDYKGNKYRTIKLGKQWWMMNNLKTTRYADGTEIPLVESISIWEALGYEEKAYCIYDNCINNEEQIYGAIYTWPGVMNGYPSSDSNPCGVQGVCPDGYLDHNGIQQHPRLGPTYLLTIFLGPPQKNAKYDGFSVPCVKDR